MATRVARDNSLDCITLEGVSTLISSPMIVLMHAFPSQSVIDPLTGDQVSKKGGMTGGFYDHRRSRLKFMNIIMQNTKSINVKEEELERVRFKLQDILLATC